jgi:signal transduction histidine kinase
MLANLIEWRGKLAPEQTEDLLDEAYQQSERLLRLAEAQLIIGKLETHDFQPQESPVGLSEALDEVTRLLRNRYRERSSRIKRRLPGELPSANCDPAHLEQVLVNLIGNALEHTEATVVTVTAKRQRSWLRVDVLDDGAGLPPDQLERVFERGAFAGGHRAHGGLGLGLYLCRLIVERSFGSHIWIGHSGPKGTRISFTVPAAK